MPQVDYERVVLGIKEFAMSKRSIGSGELLEQVAKLEVESRLPDGQELFDERPLPVRAASREQNGARDTASIA